MDVVVQEGALHDLFHSRLSDKQWISLCSSFNLPQFTHAAFEQDELQRFVFILLRHASTLVQPLTKMITDARYLKLCQQWDNLVEESLVSKQVERVQEMASSCWQFLPVELLTYIFTFVHSKDTGLVNRRWHETKCRMIKRFTFDGPEQMETFKWDLFCNVHTIRLCSYSDASEMYSLAKVPSARAGQELALLSETVHVKDYEHLSPQRLILQGQPAGEEVMKLLSTFTQLEALKLESLQIKDTIQMEVGRTVCQLHRLTQLSIANIDIIWPSESEATNMTNLTSLTLDIRNSGDHRWLAQLKQLKRLHVKKSYVEFGIENVVHMTTLTDLSVEKSEQPFRVPETVSCLSNLTALRMRWNGEFETPSTLQSLSKLTQLDMRMNHRLRKLNGEWLPEGLHTLKMKYNLIKQIDASFGQRMTNLKKLVIRERGLRDFCNLPTSLTHLSACRMEIESIEEITQLQELRIGDFRSNRIKMLPNLEGNTKLRYLNLRNNHEIQRPENTPSWISIITKSENSDPESPVFSGWYC